MSGYVAALELQALLKPYLAETSIAGHRPPYLVGPFRQKVYLVVLMLLDLEQAERNRGS